MAVSPIPPRDQMTEPEESSQLDLFAPASVGTSHLLSPDDALHLLLEAQDELQAARRREALWISIAVHALLILLLFNLGYITSLLPKRAPIAVLTPNDVLHQKDLTYLELPPDQLKQLKPPDTNVISDKNRISASMHPDQKLLKQMRDSRPPEPQGQQQPQPPPPQPQGQQQQAQQGQQQPQITQQEAPPQDAKLQPPVAKPSFKIGGTAGSMLDQATRNVAENRGGFGGSYGDFGRAQPGGGREVAGAEILSDTMGVDFGPYLQRVKHAVEQNWYAVIPEIAKPPLLKQGKVVIDFVILKDGRVAGMRVAGPSGEASFDRAAWSGISASNPFPPLPTEFKGEYLQLRFHFFYNPTANELQ